MEGSMTIDASMKPPEILAVAVRSEMDAAALYDHLRGRVKNEILIQKLEFLANEETRHKAILERLFADRFPGQKLRVPEASSGPVKSVPVDETTSALDLFKLAMEKEKQAEEYYKESKKKIEDPSSQKILDYLSRVERSHYFMLKSEIDLLEKFPEYFDVEDFHTGQDLFHVGP
jgi:rubrerythrin